MDLSNLDTATVISLIVSIVIPLLSSLLGKVHWPSEVLGILTLVISFANGFFTEWANGGDNFRWQSALVGSLVSFGIAILARYGLWKGTTTDAKLLTFPTKTPIVVDDKAA